MSSIQKVFSSDDLRKEILSFIPKRCKSCHNKLLKKFSDLNSTKYKLYWSNDWKYSKNYYHKNYCNWCCYYVFEHFI